MFDRFTIDDGRHILSIPLYRAGDIDRLPADHPEVDCWFDRGEMAPWIEAEDIAMADSAAAVAEFLPGGEYATRPESLTPDTDTRDNATRVPKARSERSSDTSDVSGKPEVGTPDMAELVERLAHDEPVVERWTLRQACEIGLVAKGYGAARQQKSEMVKRGQPFPVGEVIKGVTWYTREELESVYGIPAERG